MERLLPGLKWLRGYNGRVFADDALASLITAILLIPQSLAYALLAGLPAQAGLYASTTPLIAYALFGSSRVLAVGPVAVVSLMTAAAIGNLGLDDPGQQVAAAGALALLSGLFLAVFGALRLGLVANFLSRPVISAFITASTVLIIASQLRHMFGIDAHGATLPELIVSMALAAGEMNLMTLLIGLASLGFLLFAQNALAPALEALKVPAGLIRGLTRAAPAILVVATTLAVAVFHLEDTAGVSVVGELPTGLPPFQLPLLPLEVWRALIGPAALISLVGFVESVSVGQSLAAKRRESVKPDRELAGLGAANLAAAMTGGYPVTGGFARSVVNEQAGAQTPLAGVMTALIIMAVAMFLTPLFHDLPKAALAATILAAIWKLADFKGAWDVWRYSRADGAAAFLTLFGVLFLGVEIGLTLGVIVSIGSILQRTMHPHWTQVGQVPGTHHFRNPNRHEVILSPHVYALRVDSALYFANAHFLEDLLSHAIADHAETRDVVLMCPAVNFIDASALASLRTINQRLHDAGVTLHLSEVKGPVSDLLGEAGFLEELTGEVFLSQYAAMRTLDPATTLRAEGVLSDGMSKPL
ncbi:MAG: sulfate permease [Alphaproteobacteria bacterium]|nr:sulfate permease [Alphaproteobacteria bacterium]